MQASTSTSRTVALWILLATGTALGVAGGHRSAFAADSAAGKQSDRTLLPEEEDYSGTPFTEYGEFNEEKEETADTTFFQHGRFFGASLGLGFQGVTGNRGLLWQGGFPVIDLKVHYWFDFNVALDMGLWFVKHNYEYQGERTQVSMNNLGINVKYYFDTKNLSAPISFANPYILAGVGSVSKTETSEKDSESSDPDSAFAIGGGAGLEFAIRPKKVYFSVEGKVWYASFKDTDTTTFSRVAPDLGGMFYTIVGALMFTW